MMSMKGLTVVRDASVPRQKRLRGAPPLERLSEALTSYFTKTFFMLLAFISHSTVTPLLETVK